MVKAEAAGTVLLFPLLAILGISITVLAVNRQHLADVEVWCWSYYPYYSCATFYGGCLVSDNINDYGPCQYAYAVGAISLFSSLINLCFSCVDLAGVASIVGGIFHLIWWCVAAAYFTSEWQDAHALPEDYWRHVLMGVSWAAFCMGVLQLVMAGGLCVMGRRKKGSDYEDKGEANRQAPISS
ncbi:hypothetical protein HYH03_007307 [Edaphochlamys debaryana]|uniref:Uncharacterized protein n=1 Tax=Edaphochlamys debaryana TaxID=47281 RepID=A0A835Y8V2_9CHLO|nr:hypothetical protein HYH03_007307 [Edaphochlamys debaryana]|eukprot:KAG2494540.1 hypothetical protein HYH03_007307 [Edaphochlamys debaryana]